MKTIITKNLINFLTFVSLVASAALILFVMGDREYPLPWRLADGWRIITMATCGIVIGYMSLILKIMWHLKYDPRDDLVIPFTRLMGLFMVLTLFIGVHLFQRQGMGTISWRTPIAFFTMSLAALTLHQLYIRFKAAVSKVKDGGKFRLSVTATYHQDDDEPTHSEDLMEK